MFKRWYAGNFCKRTGLNELRDFSYWVFVAVFIIRTMQPGEILINISLGSFCSSRTMVLLNHFFWFLLRLFLDIWQFYLPCDSATSMEHPGVSNKTAHPHTQTHNVRCIHTHFPFTPGFKTCVPIYLWVLRKGNQPRDLFRIWWTNSFCLQLQILVNKGGNVSFILILENREQCLRRHSSIWTELKSYGLWTPACQ